MKVYATRSRQVSDRCARGAGDKKPFFKMSLVSRTVSCGLACGVWADGIGPASAATPRDIDVVDACTALTAPLKPGKAQLKTALLDQQGEVISGIYFADVTLEGVE